jgi:hypothetical protein
MKLSVLSLRLGKGASAFIADDPMRLPATEKDTGGHWLTLPFITKREDTTRPRGLGRDTRNLHDSEDTTFPVSFAEHPSVK